jgi:hypothetical protein
MISVQKIYNDLFLKTCLYAIYAIYAILCDFMRFLQFLHIPWGGKKGKTSVLSCSPPPRLALLPRKKMPPKLRLLIRRGGMEERPWEESAIQ